MQVYNLREFPDFRREFDRLHAEGWPEFMRHDEKADLYWEMLMSAFADFQILLCDDDQNVMAIGNSIPIVWNGTIARLPSGWEEAFERGIQCYRGGVIPDALSALAIVVDPRIQGKGLSGYMIKAMKDMAKEAGFSHLIVPLRPSMKCRYPLTPIEKYAEWKTQNGLPFDPWLRTHAKAGGEVLAIAEQSMLIKGSVGDWEEWTGMRFPESGEYVIPGALTTVQIDCENNVGLYTEPNIWVRHELFEREPVQ